MSLIGIIVSLLQVYIYIIIARALISWFSPNMYNPFWRFLVDITEPPLKFIRDNLTRHIPVFRTIDISPIILIIAINILINLISSGTR